MDDKMSSRFKTEAIQLIEFKGNSFSLNEEAMEILNSIEEDIIVVSVVGKARTGKSYLMNLLLDNIGKNQGFQVDSKISSCTKGIWLWGAAKNSLSSPNAKIIFIDSEGTSSTDRSTKTYDSRIFALIVLISSLFIYNTTSNIDEFGISELSLAAHLSNSVTTNTNIDKDNLLTELAPKFIWVLRDFTLEKRHPETNQEISSKEYLELCLRKKISGKNSKDNNLIRDNIIKYFPERDCVTLSRPIDSESDLRNLNNIPFEKLKSNFKMEFKYLKDKIYKETQPKRINGKKMNGSALAQFIIEIVTAINSGVIPNINNSWDKVVMDDIVGYKNKALNSFKENVKKLNDSDRIKSEESRLREKEDLYNLLLDFKLGSVMKYNKLLYVNPDIVLNKAYSECFLKNKESLENEIDKLLQKAINENNEKCDNYCNKVLRESYKDIEKKIYDDAYDLKTTHDLNEDCTNLFNKYLEHAKGLRKAPIFYDFFSKTLNKNVIEYINKISKNKINSKLQTLDHKIKSVEDEIFGIESEMERTSDLIKDKDFKIQIQDNELKKTENQIDHLNEQIAELTKQLETLKIENKERDLKEIESKGKTNIINEGESIVKETNKVNHQRKKKEGCYCNCNVY